MLHFIYTTVKALCGLILCMKMNPFFYVSYLRFYNLIHSFDGETCWKTSTRKTEEIEG
jgi:hypothetical protein